MIEVMRRRVGLIVRTLRRRRGWSQAELGTRARTSRFTVSRIERDLLTGVALDAIDRVVGALGARLRLEVDWHGERLDRLLDERHARLQEEIAALLAAAGWLIRTEVSFNHYGDRGRYDVIAFHPVARLVLVVEVKTVIGDVQATVGRLDVKVRVAPIVAAELGWRPEAVVPLLVIAEGGAQRRTVVDHAALFGRLSVRGHAALGWLQRPAGPVSGLLLFRKLPNEHQPRRHEA